MNREREVAKNSIIFTAGRLLSQAVGFLLLPLYSSLLTPEDYGTSDLLITLVFLIIPFVGASLDNALFRFSIDIRDDRDRLSSLLTTVLSVNLCQILLYSFIYFLIRPFILLQFRDYLLVNVILQIFVNAFLQFLRGTYENIRYSVAVFITSVSGLIMNVLLVAVLRFGLSGIIISSVLSYLITLIYLVIVIRPWNYYDLKKFSKDSAVSMFKYSIPLIPNQLAWWVMGISDRLVISGTVGVSANGIYSLSNKFSSVYTSVSDSINLSWTESVSSHISDEDRSSYISRMSGSLLSLFASGCYLMIVITPFVFMLIDDKYSDSFMQVPILMAAVLSQAVVGIYSSVLIALKKTKNMALTSIIAAAVNLVITVSLIGRNGIYAASVSTLVSFTFLAVMRSVLVSRYIDIRPGLGRMLLLLTWGSLVIAAYYLRNPLINVISLIVSISLALVINFNILKQILNFIGDRIVSRKIEEGRQKIYGNMKKYDGSTAVYFDEDLIEISETAMHLTYKDESWNYIKNFRKYMNDLSRGRKPYWDDNECHSDKYLVSNDQICIKTGGCADNWLCFYLNETLPDSYEISFDICIHTDFTEIQVAFNYIDLGNRYRFMIKNNRICLFEAVYKGSFLEPFIETPISLSLDEKHTIVVRVIENIYEFYIDGHRCIAVEDRTPGSINGNRASLILWNENDLNAIECEISDLRIKGNRS